MNISVIGAGAMGSLFGGLLHQAGETVTLFSRNTAHINAVNSKGLTIETDGLETIINVPATFSEKAIPKTDLALICVKAKDTVDAAKIAKRSLSEKGFVLTLQNGIGHGEILSEIIGEDRVFAGTTSHGATLLSSGCVRHAGHGHTTVGRWQGPCIEPLEKVKDILTQAGIHTEITHHIHNVIWKKLIINVGINAITALTDIQNGALLDRDDTKILVENAALEAIAIATAEGITIETDIMDLLFQVIERTSANRSSMGQDVDKKKETEIDAINGAIVRLAEKHKMDVPINKTLTALIKTRESHY